MIFRATRIPRNFLGVQVAWALIAKTLPPRVVHFLRANPVSETAELTEILQEGLQDTLRQCMGVPATTANQLHAARLPVSAGSLGLFHLPSLAVIAHCMALATMPRASDTAAYRQSLLDNQTEELFHRLRDVCDRETATRAGNMVDPPPGREDHQFPPWIPKEHVLISDLVTRK